MCDNLAVGPHDRLTPGTSHNGNRFHDPRNEIGCRANERQEALLWVLQNNTQPTKAVGELSQVGVCLSPTAIEALKVNIETADPATNRRIGFARPGLAVEAVP